MRVSAALFLPAPRRLPGRLRPHARPLRLPHRPPLAAAAAAACQRHRQPLAAASRRSAVAFAWRCQQRRVSISGPRGFWRHFCRPAAAAARGGPGRPSDPEDSGPVGRRERLCIVAAARARGGRGGSGGLRGSGEHVCFHRRQQQQQRHRTAAAGGRRARLLGLGLRRRLQRLLRVRPAAPGRLRGVRPLPAAGALGQPQIRPPSAPFASAAHAAARQRNLPDAAAGGCSRDRARHVGYGDVGGGHGRRIRNLELRRRSRLFLLEGTEGRRRRGQIRQRRARRGCWRRREDEAQRGEEGDGRRQWRPCHYSRSGRRRSSNRRCWLGHAAVVACRRLILSASSGGPRHHSARCQWRRRTAKPLVPAASVSFHHRGAAARQLFHPPGSRRSAPGESF